MPVKLRNIHTGKSKPVEHLLVTAPLRGSPQCLTVNTVRWSASVIFRRPSQDTKKPGKNSKRWSASTGLWLIGWNGSRQQPGRPLSENEAALVGRALF